MKGTICPAQKLHLSSCKVLNCLFHMLLVSLFSVKKITLIYFEWVGEVKYCHIHDEKTAKYMWVGSVNIILWPMKSGPCWWHVHGNHWLAFLWDCMYLVSLLLLSGIICELIMALLAHSVHVANSVLAMYLMSIPQHFNFV